MRLVTINTGLIADDNFYLTWTDENEDLGNQLKWLEHVLGAAKSLNEKVFIVQHHPFHSCVSELANEYYNTYKEYGDIIQGTSILHTLKKQHLTI